MTRYIFLGIIQGVTEFLPISSSAHISIAEHIFGITQNQVAIAVVLHLATAFALGVFFIKEIFEIFTDLKLLIMLAVASVITAAIGLLGKNFFEGLFSCTVAIGAALIVNGIMLLFTRFFFSGKRTEIGLKDAAIFGFTQSIAIIPGISRSGVTISTLLFRNIDPINSFRFSFLAALPVILGAAILEARDIHFVFGAETGGLICGFIASFVASLLSLNILKFIMKRSRFYYFGYYCIVLGIAVLIFIK